jgi:hypothetical protein
LTALPEPLTKRARKALRRTARSKREPRTLPVREVEMPTPERIAHAGEGYRSVIVDGERRTRIDDSPLERIYYRGQLSPDEGVAGHMLSAGRRFREDWYTSGLSGPGAINYAATARGEGDSPWSMPASEFAMRRRQSWRAARKVLGPLAQAVGLIVLEEVDTVEAGRIVSGRKDRTTATRIAMDQLRDGLRTLAVHYGYMRA